jgi:hypothetical protein
VSLRHRSYRGQMVYRTNGLGEMGREFFSVSVYENGARTLRAQCEMDDDQLLRDVTLSVDPLWRPTDGFVRLTIHERFVGSGWFRFSDRVAECESFTANDGRLSQRFDLDEPAACFGTHALHGDAWTVGRLRQHTGPADAFRFVTFASSTLPNGGSGPALIPVPAGFARVIDHGPEVIEGSAGRFDTRHIRIEVPGVDFFDVWAGGEDCLPVRLTSDVLNQTYELTAVSGDWR